MYISIALALFLMVMNILEKVMTFSKAEYAVSATIAVAMLFLPLLVSLREELLSWRQWKGGHHTENVPVKKAVVSQAKKEEEATL
ncbi:hypothetical protein ACT3J6_21800, partial [Mycobacterium tuberculosis]